MTWKLVDRDTPRDRLILLRGGHYDGARDFRADDEDIDLATAPVVARWKPPTPGWGGNGYWIVTCYDSGVCAIEYHEPKEWTEIPA